MCTRVMQRRLLGLVWASWCWAIFGQLAFDCSADIISIDPFTGDRSEDFSSFMGGQGNLPSLEIFGGDVTLMAGAGGSVKVEFSSLRGGDLVIPRSPQTMVGHFLPMNWNFHTPIVQFGGYFENNSRFDDIIVDMYDAQNQLIGSVVATAPKDAQAWTWNGWRSDIPIHRIVTTGNDVDFFNGFVWYDDMEITYAAIPEPNSAGLFCAIGVVLLLAKGRRKSKRRIPRASMWQRGIVE